MNFSKILLILAIIVSAIFIKPGKVFANSYYVSTTGNDNNSGSYTAPFRTFSKAVSILRPGDILEIFAGTYTQPLVVTTSGTSGSLITIKPAGNGTVIIDRNFSGEKNVDVPASYISISGIEVTRSSGTCASFTGQFIETRNFVVHECQGHGTYVDGKNILVEGHTIYRTNLENQARTASSGWGSALKVRVGGENLTLQKNTIYHNYGEGIAVTRGKNVIVKNNRVYDNFTVNIFVDNSYDVSVDSNFVTCSANTGFERDGNRPTGIALAEEYYEGWGAKLARVQVVNNIIGFCNRSVVYWGSNVANAGGLDDVLIAYNTMWQSINTALSLEYEPYKTRNTLITNNIIGQPDGKLEWIENNTGITLHHNFWVGGIPQDSFARGIGDKYGDVKFATIPNYDPVSYRLSLTSPARDAAENISSLAYDFEGKNRFTTSSPGSDMGAIETEGAVTPSSTPSSSAVTKQGDANNDGLVNALDYSVWFTYYNKSVSGGASQGDFNLNGKVDGIDYVIWLNNYGN